MSWTVLTLWTIFLAAPGVFIAMVAARGMFTAFLAPLKVLLLGH